MRAWRARRRSARRLQVAVAGGGACGRRTAALARTLGRELAAAGAVVVCGGLGGVMAAVARGAAERGGTVLGILPGYDRALGNRWLTLAVPSGLGHARNVLVAAAGDVLIALRGERGTRSEIELAAVLGRPVVALGAWHDVDGVTVAQTVQEAVRRALALARQRTPRVLPRTRRRARATPERRMSSPRTTV